jgi:soluble lytic murein transglycosylase-like protein
MQAQPTPNPALATAVRAGRWAEVRTLAASVPGPLPPAVALVAARAARKLGEPERALALLRAALPSAGELVAALRLEAAEATLALGQDPSPDLAPMLANAGPPAHQRAAADCLRRAWEVLPVAVLRRARPGGLPATLRRELAVRLAIRGSDEALALHVLAERSDDQPALGAAEWLAGRPPLAPSTRLAVAATLLTQGAWRQAETLLVALPPPPNPDARFRWAFLRGRAAYRLERFAIAAKELDQALALATSDKQRFAAAVQRARVAEIERDYPAALGFWGMAQAARPREVEGWDGSARALVALGRAGEAVTLVARCPAPALRVAGPRLAATLLLRHDPAHARVVLAHLPQRLPAVRVLSVALLAQVGDAHSARAAARRLLADPRAGTWREQVLDLLTRPPDQDGHPPPTRNLEALASIATSHGLSAARRALAAALAADPGWAPVVSGSPSAPASWTGAAPSLAAFGLEHEAAAIYPHTFPAASPEESAWSARTLAAWGNRTAALSYGERLWAQLGPIPAVLLPEGVSSAILPTDLVGGCVTAAKEYGIPAPWLVAIIRQESRFDPDARSIAGAVGVAQLVPETARRQGATPEEVRNEDLALSLAAQEVARLAKRFGPRPALVAAAYNAGETVVASWLAELGDRGGEALFTAAIPYGETAGYVLAVNEGIALARYSK